LLATSLPPVRPGGSAAGIAPPPPSDLKFSTASSPPAFPAGPPARPTPPPRPAAPPPPLKPAAPPPPVAAPAAPPPPVAAPALGDALDDDILGLGRPAPVAAEGDAVDPYFQDVFEQFLATKQSCGEPTTGL